MKRLTWKFAGLLAVIALLAGGGQALALNLGAASGFSVLSTGGSPTLGGTTVNGGNVAGVMVNLAASSVSSNALGTLNSGIAIVMSNASSVAGTCITGGGSIVLKTGSTCAAQDTTGTNPLLSTYATASSNARLFSNQAQNLTPNQAFGSFIVPTSGSANLFTSVAGGTTVVTMADLIVGQTGGNATLTINGAASDYILINIFGDFFLYPNSSILLAGGIPASHVVFNVVCSGSSVEGSGTTIYNGTIVAMGRRCDLGSTTLNGQVICGADVDTNPVSTINFIPLGNLP